MNGKVNHVMFNSVIHAGQTALTSALLINGAAAIALLAFIGNIIGDPIAKTYTSMLSESLLWFAGGVLTAAIAMGTTYCTQHSFHKNQGSTQGKIFNGLSIGLVISAYLTFWMGVYNSYLVFQIK